MKLLDGRDPSFWRAAWICAFLLALSALLASADAGKSPTVPPAMPETPAATNTINRVHVFVSGVVQGVGFRNFTASKATTLNLTGWVKNLPDGRVELVAEGPADNIGKLMDAVAKGPSGARVDKVEREEVPPTGQFKRFETLR